MILTSNWRTKYHSPESTRVIVDTPEVQDKEMVVMCPKPQLDSAIADFWSSDGAPLIQHAFPFLSAEEREFLLTGMTPQDWDELMGPEEEDSDLEP